MSARSNERVDKSKESAANDKKINTRILAVRFGVSKLFASSIFKTYTRSIQVCTILIVRRALTAKYF